MAASMVDRSSFNPGDGTAMIDVDDPVGVGGVRDFAGGTRPCGADIVRSSSDRFTGTGEGEFGEARVGAASSPSRNWSR